MYSTSYRPQSAGWPPPTSPSSVCCVFYGTEPAHELFGHPADDATLPPLFAALVVPGVGGDVWGGHDGSNSSAGLC